MSRVLVIGGGVAGCSTGIFLAKAGLEVVVVERRAPTVADGIPKLGESLPPEARPLLDELGVWSAFQEDGHLPCHSHRSYWGSDQASHRDFLNHPLGHGWHLDRSVFDLMLEKQCELLGVRILRGSGIEAAEHDGAGWLVNDDERFDCIVDASGRSSWFAQRQGVERLVHDNQLALIAFLEGAGALDDTSSLTESTDDGWWYSAAIPGRRIATVFLAKPDEFQRRNWRDHQGWWSLLSRAKHTFHRIRGGSFELLGSPRFVSAESGILDSLVGADWLAVGDAAMSYDPIASHGVMMGMVGARDAAKAIVSHLSGDAEALVSYHETLSQAFFQYTQLRGALYAQLDQPYNSILS